MMLELGQKVIIKKTFYKTETMPPVSNFGYSKAWCGKVTHIIDVVPYEDHYLFHADLAPTFAFDESWMEPVEPKSIAKIVTSKPFKIHLEFYDEDYVSTKEQKSQLIVWTPNHRLYLFNKKRHILFPNSKCVSCSHPFEAHNSYLCWCCGETPSEEPVEGAPLSQREIQTLDMVRNRGIRRATQISSPTDADMCGCQECARIRREIHECESTEQQGDGELLDEEPEELPDTDEEPVEDIEGN